MTQLTILLAYRKFKRKVMDGRPFFSDMDGSMLEMEQQTSLGHGVSESSFTSKMRYL